MPLTNRQLHLFDTLVREYSRAGVPVASEALAREFGVSSATIRNDFLVLDEQGLTVQPHTSSGRIPTEKGYRAFIERHHAAVGDQPRPYAARVGRGFIPRRATTEEAVKHIAKSMAEIMETAVVVGLSPRDAYYTGLSYVFAQPEFEELPRVQRLSVLMDHIDEIMEDVFARVLADDAQIWLGRENPFGRECGLIVIRFHTRNQHGVLGLVGPMRMDYERGIGLVEYAQEVLRKF